MLCKDCPHFHITEMPLRGIDEGHAVCNKHNLITDFLTMKKFEWLECVEQEEAQMADILIRMHMPTNCIECKIGYEDMGDYCSYLNDDVGEFRKARRPDCPLHELPKHGDLVDLDARVDAQFYDDMYEEWTIKTVSVRDLLHSIVEEMPPIVIAASKEETE